MFSPVRLSFLSALLLAPLCPVLAIPEVPLEEMPEIKGICKAGLLTSVHGNPGVSAIHPVSGQIYFSDDQEGGIFSLNEGKTAPALPSQLTWIDDLPVWALTPTRNKAFWSSPRIQTLGSMTFASDGHLFAVENTSRGRLLEFIPDPASGLFTSFRTIPVPWVNKDYAWTGVAVSSNGRLFISGTAADPVAGLNFGVVLMRDTKKSWWVIDYGPFAGFNSVTLSRNEDILIVTDKAKGNLTWWDTYRHRAIGSVNRSFPGVVTGDILPNGSILIAEVEEHKKGQPSGRVLSVDPRNGDTTILATGFGAIRSLRCDKTDGSILVTQENRPGLIILRLPDEKATKGPYLLENTIRVFEMANGLPPKTWPPYLKGFFKDLGVSPRDEETREGEQGQETGDPNSFTLAEVGEMIPMVAGRLRTKDEFLSSDPDPVVALDFLVLFPNRSVTIDNEATPGLSFFSARKRSGEVENTYTLDQMQGLKYSPTEGWSFHSKKSTIYLPATACTVTPTEEGMDITVAFISPSGGRDYYLQLSCGANYNGSLTVDEPGNRKVRYGVDFDEETTDGAAYNSIVVAGFGTKNTENPGWLNIGNYPVGYSFSPGEQVNWVPHSIETKTKVDELLKQGSQGEDIFAPIGL